MLGFHDRLSTPQRIAECRRMLRKHPSHVAAILVPADRETPLLPQEKYVLSPDLTGAQLLYALRGHLGALQPSQALFLLCGNRMVHAAATMRELRTAHQNLEDGFLYLTYSTEHAFGR